MSTFHFVLEVKPPGRDVSDEGWEEIVSAHIEALQKSAALLNQRTASVDRNTLKLRIDWTPYVGSYRRYYRVMQAIESFKKQPRGKDKYLDILRRFPRRRVNIPLEVSTSSRKIEQSQHISMAAIESFLHDVFLIMNIAAPGSCNFYLATLRAVEENDSTVRSRTRLDLSSVSFDIALLNTRSGQWPPVRMIDVSKVIAWIFSQRTGISQIPGSRGERILFSLLHIAMIDINPSVVVWIFYALETLFDTRPGENRRALEQRAIQLLSPNDKDAAILKKRLRELYEYRSKLVHGGLDITHPMHSEVIDGRVEAKYLEFAKLSEFGFALVLASLQTMIENGWQELEFSEKMIGKPIAGT